MYPLLQPNIVITREIAAFGVFRLQLYSIRILVGIVPWNVACDWPILTLGRLEGKWQGGKQKRKIVKRLVQCMYMYNERIAGI